MADNSVRDDLDLFEDSSDSGDAEDTNSDVVTNQLFDPNLVRIDSAEPTIDIILNRIKLHEITLNPDFQRRGGIWDDFAQSRLIESLLVRIPLPAFYFDATDDDNWLVVDGQQRLMALKRYVLDQEFPLKGVESLISLNGYYFRDLPRNLQRRILETQLTIFRIQSGTPDAVKFTIFKRINTGGLPLSAQEIRHALNPGKAAQILERLAGSDEFLKATDAGISNSRMADRECVLRFLTFLRHRYTEYSREDFDAFLNRSMGELNGVSDDVLRDLEEVFLMSMRLSSEIFGQTAFRKLGRKRRPRAAINKALFEAWSVNIAVFAGFGVERVQSLVDGIRALNESLLEDERFLSAVSFATGSPVKVRTRFEMIEEGLSRLVAA